MTTKSYPRSITTNQTPPKLMVGEDTVTPLEGRAVAVDSNGRVSTANLVAVGGGTPAATIGTNARVVNDITLTIDSGMTITVHPLVGGVTVAVTTAAGAAVSASGKAVTLTAKNAPALTTVADMQALIAASSTVSPLLSISGTALDTFDAAVSIAATNTWTSGNVPVAAGYAMSTDGYFWPVETNSSKGLKTSPMLPVAGAAATEVVGVSGNMPEAKTTTLNAVGPVTATWTPKVGQVQIVLATGAARSLSVTGRVATVTVIVGVTTYAEIAADWAANASALALASIGGTAGAVAAGYAGETLSLWTARTIGATESFLKNSDGYLVPWEQDAATGAGKVYQRGMNTATDAQQTMPVVACPKGVNGPAVLLSSAALVEVAGSYDIDVPVSNYDQISVAVYIDAAAGDTYQIDLYARLDDQAVGDWHLVNGQFTATGATALGAAADPCALLACITTRKLFRELRVRRTKVNNNGNAVARIWIMEGR